jgi:hypothetical protein
MPSRGSELLFCFSSILICYFFHPYYPVASPDRGFGSRRLGPRPIHTGFPPQEAKPKLKNLIYLFYLTENLTITLSYIHKFPPSILFGLYMIWTFLFISSLSWFGFFKSFFFEEGKIRVCEW